MKAIIFAGGVGTRLWPLSRKKSPKQFEKIVDNFSMLQLAVNRLYPDFASEDIYIATGKQYYDIVKEQLPRIPASNIITEPEMRDVGPAVGLVTAIFSKISPNEPFILLWGSDHLVREEALFRKVLKSAGELILKDKEKIIFVGQKPRFASQNLGWIEYGELVNTVNDIEIYEFKGFKYRPDLKTAQKFLKDGKHTWNLGYYVTTPIFLWGLFKEFVPEIYTKLETIQKAYNTPKFNEVLKTVYPTIEKISFDDAILEKLNPKFAYVMSERLAWSDVGAWEALKEALETFPNDNVTKGNVYLKDTLDSLVYNLEDKKLVVCIDANASIIVNTPDVLLIANKTSVPKIKKVVEGFKGTENEKLT